MNPSLFLEELEDFRDLLSTTSGVSGGTVALINSEANRTGIVRFDTGGAATNRAGTRPGSIVEIILGASSGTIICEWYVRVPTLSTVGEEFMATAGLTDAITNPPTNAVMFRYDRLTNTNWLAVTRAGGVETATVIDTGVAVTAGAWVKLRVTITNNTSCVFNINGSDVATLSSNIPSVVIGQWAGIFKSAGTTARQFEADYAYLKHTFGAAR